MSDSASDSTQRSGGGLAVAVQYLTANKTEAALLATRALTLAFVALFLVPLSSLAPQSAYQKALMASAATSALRLHQRLPPLRASREFLALLLAEDSAHYLLYALLFVSNAALSLALLPIALFAGLHFSAQTLALIDRSGQRGWTGAALAVLVEQHQRSILATAALAEMALMPALVVAVLAGHASLLAPFLYYRFVALRYASRRNPYSRQMFGELRQSCEALVARPSCPQMVRTVVMATVRLVERLAPPLVS